MCVLHNHHYFYYGYIAAFLSAVLMFFLKHYADKKIYKKMALMSLLAIMGVINDLMLAYFKIFIFPGLWLVVLWLCFAAWFCDADWINQKYSVTAIAFMMAGPLSYLAGAKLGALHFYDLNATPIIFWVIDWFMLGLIFVRTNSLKKRYC